ncbi:MAG: hypothetical protein KF734_16560 [Saprospiraceae bacterium]|nr:hypothetical protein [Saprospiraceae bacterium]
MIYNQISPEQVSIDFINGYLTPWALLMDYCTNEVGYTYFFRRIEKSGDLHETVFQTIKNGLDTRDGNTERKSILPLKEKRGLVEITDWENTLKGHLQPWFWWMQETLKTNKNGRFWPDDFLEVFKVFFQNQNIRCWKMEEWTKNDLFYDWGGIGFDDFFFENEGYVFHLHFQVCD